MALVLDPDKKKMSKVGKSDKNQDEKYRRLGDYLDLNSVPFQSDAVVTDHRLRVYAVDKSTRISEKRAQYSEIRWEVMRDQER